MQAEMIDHIRFTAISPDMVKKMSVAKIVVADTCNDDGYPIDGALLDQRMGVIDPGLKCKTCGGRPKTCPGHFGHIELVRPTIHPEFAKSIYLMLSATCESCHRVLLNEKQIEALRPEIEHIMSEDDFSENTTESQSKSLNTIKKLKTVKKCPHCGVVQHKLKFERPTFFYMEGNKMKPDEILDWLSKISNEDLSLLRIDGTVTRPEWFVLTALLVPPVNIRPSITLESGERSEDDLTHKLLDIIRTNQRLEQDIDAGAPQIIIDDLWELLQYQVTTYFNNETPGVPVARHRSTRPLKTLAQRLKGKEGRVRYNLSGKRVNFSARTVISPDNNLELDQVGVPQRIAENLSVPLYVTKWNFDIAKRYMQNIAYPLVTNHITKDGIRKRVTETNREELLAALQPGDILERQLIDEDIVLFNRQPTLHRISMMAHRVKVLPGKTFRIHLSACTPYNADFDGDEMNMHVPQSIEAQAEARFLMPVARMILSARDGMPVMFLSEDIISGLFALTKDGTAFQKEEAMRMLTGVGVYELPKGSKGMYTGRAIFSMILPRDLNLEVSGRETKIVIKNGQLIEGYINKGVVGSHGALLIELFNRYGPDEAKRFIDNATKLAGRVVYTAGTTISLKDYYNSEEMKRQREKIISEVQANVDTLYKRYKDKQIEPLPGYTRRQTYELETFTTLNVARDMIDKVLRSHLTLSNNAMLMASIGSRGSSLNLVQTSMFLGQQSVRGERPSRGYSKRILPYFKSGDRNPETRGFVKSNFLNGMSFIDYYLHAMGARDSAVGKPLMTADSGYLQRRLINALQDFYVEKDLSVRDASGSVIQTIYGGDGVDPVKVTLAESIGDKKACAVAPGEAVGTVAAQSLGEPGTQMLLKTFHQAGVMSTMTVKGLPRIKELVDARKSPKTPMIEIQLEKGVARDLEKANAIKKKIEEVKVKRLLSSFDEDFKGESMRLALSKEKLALYELSEHHVLSKLGKIEGVKVGLADHVIKVELKKQKEQPRGIKDLRIRFIHIRDTSIKGVKGISKVTINQMKDGGFYLLALGNNIEGVMQIDGVDRRHVYSNNPFEVSRVLGIEAARTLIMHELDSTVREADITVSIRHIGLIADAMTFQGNIKSVGRHGIVGGKNSVFARAAYEETVKHFTNACIFGERDMLTGVAENILIGKQVNIGTGTVKLGIKKENLKALKAED